jgi:hypothetical protein
MGFARNVMLWLSPPKVIDPAFGKLVFMHISKRPERSYWEGEWKLPRMGHTVGICLRGGEDGPSEIARRFYLDIPEQIERILELCRPPLSKVFSEWLNRQLPEDMFSELKLVGFDLDDPSQRPLLWSMSFETTGGKWLGITIPFIDNTVGEAEVDT